MIFGARQSGDCIEVRGDADNPPKIELAKSFVVFGSGHSIRAPFVVLGLRRGRRLAEGADRRGRALRPAPERPRPCPTAATRRGRDRPPRVR